MRWMRIGITYRLFVAILAAATVAVVAVFLVAQWSVKRGLERYADQLEQATVLRLVDRLEARYAAQGSWDSLRTDPDEWHQLIVESLPDQDIGREIPEQPGTASDRSAGERVSPLLRQFGRRLEARVTLLDAERAPLLGSEKLPESMRSHPLRHQDHVVGYLALHPRGRPPQLRALQHVLGQQFVTLGVVAGVVVLIAAVLSFPLAHRLVQPLRALATATHQLAAGQFTTRVPIRSSDEVGQLARDFNTLALTLEKNDQARRQWVADISHELRTPLAILRGEIEALQDGIRPATPEALRSLHAETLRLGRLVEDLHQLALSDLGALTYRKADLDLLDLLADAAAAHREAFVEKGLVLSLERARTGSAGVFGDRERLRQLFGNLLENALKYTDPGGGVMVRLTREDDAAVVDVQDSAPAVPEPDLAKLFDRLFRVEVSRARADGGAGLGLAICKNIVEAHAGAIEARLSPLGGLWIRVWLPLSEPRV